MSQHYLNTLNTQRLLNIVSASGHMSIAELGQCTRWATPTERRRILKELFEAGKLIEVMRHTKGRPAYGVAVSANAIVGTDWICLIEPSSESAANENTSPELWVVEYSPRQRWFRVDRLVDVSIKNLSLLMKKTPSDFSLLYVGTQEQCWEVCQEIEEKFILKDGRHPEVHQPADQQHKIKQLRKRVMELEDQLEAMMGYPCNEPRTTGTQGTETMALLEKRGRGQDPASGERDSRQVE